MENNIENIEKFRLVRYFGQNGELSPEEIEKLGFPKEDYMTLSECAYQCAYDISNDWIRDTPNWDDVQDAYKRKNMMRDYIRRPAFNDRSFI